MNHVLLSFKLDEPEHHNDRHVEVITSLSSDKIDAYIEAFVAFLQVVGFSDKTIARHLNCDEES